MTNYRPPPKLMPAAPPNRYYEVGLAPALMLEDLQLVMGAAASILMGTAAERLCQPLADIGAGGSDFSAPIKMVEGLLDA